jgi:hypothetical protein
VVGISDAFGKGRLPIRKVTGPATVAAVAAIAAVASAGELTGTLEEIDLTQGTITVEGQLFAVSDTNTAGATIEDLKERDEMQVSFADSDSGEPIEPMQVDTPGRSAA